MRYSESELQGLHATLYEIISEIDRICQKHDIRYFVTGGTAIGAHFWQAIIPWDDDVDIGMTRDNYERFLSVAPDELSPLYFLQTPETEKHTPFIFAKVRRNDSMFSESQFSSIEMHQGIYVDIFPFDRIPADKRAEKRQYNQLHLLNGLFIATEIWQWEHCGHCDVENPRPRGFFPCLATRIIISIIPKKVIFKLIRKVQTKYDDSGSSECKQTLTVSEHLPLTDATETVRMPLGPLEVSAPRNIVNYLTNHYGKIRKDYPEELRVNHRPSILKFPDNR